MKQPEVLLLCAWCSRSSTSLLRLVVAVLAVQAPPEMASARPVAWSLVVSYLYLWYGSLRRDVLAHAYTLQVTDRASRGSLSLYIYIYVVLTTVSLEI